MWGLFGYEDSPPAQQQQQQQFVPPLHGHPFPGKQEAPAVGPPCGSATLSGGLMVGSAFPNSGVTRAMSLSEMQDELNRVHTMTRELLMEQERQLLAKLEEERQARQTAVEELRRELLGDSSSASQSPFFAGGAAKAPSDINKEVSSLRSRMDKICEELQSELQTMRLQSERSAVKAGFLAVAASECGQEEKAFLFNKLKAREDALVALDAKGNSSMALPNYPTASTAGLSPSKQVPEQRFDVTLDKRSGKRLGVSVVLGEKFVIEEILTDGLIKEWNDRNPAKRILPNDEIVSANGVAGSAESISEAADAARQTLVLTVRRLGR
eukprot:TRINITY_DN13444_c0_g1_i1.p1 TRINITY_DN13444_c0_g1~~TRINITY_DN13444_c0_g1_i1.p1  ORF type:complete len:325 (+),score=92.87 TRINITY_DN13444_c0_g1_i1:76-1050(+)